MIRKEAMKIVLEEIGNDPIISANGFISRDLFELNEKKTNFYMIGSMGLRIVNWFGSCNKKSKENNLCF